MRTGPADEQRRSFATGKSPRNHIDTFVVGVTRVTSHVLPADAGVMQLLQSHP